MTTIHNEKIIAVDVALLPPEELRDLVIQLSKEISEKHPESFMLGKDRLPHITLAMAFIEEKDLNDVIGAINKVMKSVPPVSLANTGHQVWDDPTAEIRFANTQVLTSLHISLLNMLQPFHHVIEGRQEYFVFDQGEKTTQRLLNWPKTYIQNLQTGNYRPHITLGTMLPEKKEIEKKTYVCTNIGLFQLGNWCTCRKKLHEWKLS